MIPLLGRLEQMDFEFEPGLGYIVRQDLVSRDDFLKFDQVEQEWARGYPPLAMRSKEGAAL